MGCSGVPIGDHGERLVEAGDSEAASKMRERFALEDYRDVFDCNLLVHFSEKPREPSTNRGGRHVELGIALGLAKRVAVIGYRENIFHWFDAVRFYPTWSDLALTLQQPEA